MADLKLKQVSSLEKIFLNKECNASEYNNATMLKNEEFAYQIVISNDTVYYYWSALDITVNSPIAEYITLYKVDNVPSEMTTFKNCNCDRYITKEPGLFPDVLSPLKDGSIRIIPANRAIWVNIKPDGNVKAGTYPITVNFKDEADGIDESITFNIEIIDAVLPEQKLIFTQWFHGDCIAVYYKEEIFSESHWEHIENFIKTAAEHGINMILTPVFTPPLDTEVGGERPTIQLVDVFLKNGKYSFNFDKLDKWIDICHKHGIKYIEISHLFTQWGAEFTPKIIADVDGEEKRIFGWDVLAVSNEYKEFLAAFMPALTEYLKKKGIAENTYFHISDEPTKEHLEKYKASSEIAKEYLKDFKIIDALSDYEFYNYGLIKHPVPGTNHIKPFLGIEDLWTYYCCSQYEKVSNRFMAMPSYRNRIIGLQLYKFNIKGFLHWGYNFYYSQYSKYPINPYYETDAGYGFPSGDSYSVYPAEDGTALPSLRLKVFLHALQDMRAMELLETKIPREEIIKLIDSEGEMDFENYPDSAEFILNFREKINEMIKSNI